MGFAFNSSMSPLTAILLLLFAVFVIGIVLLERQKKRPAAPIVALPDWAAESLVSGQEESVSLKAKVLALDKKMELSAVRLQRLEGIVANLPLSRLEKEFDVQKLEQKVERLVDFRNQAEIELRALQDALALPKKSASLDWNKTESRSFDEKIRALAFNSKTTKKNSKK